DNKDAMKKVRHGDRSISNAYAELANRGKPLKRLGTPLARVAKDDTKADKLYIRRTESWPVRARDAREEVCLQADFFAVSLHGLRGALLRGAFEPELRDGHLAHPELLHLARHRRRELVDELPVRGNLERGDPAAAERGQLLAADRRRGLPLHPRHHFLPVLVARHADDLHVEHGGMRVEIFLDLARVHILAAADDHVLDAADDVDVAVLVGGGEVAGVHPAAGVDRVARRLLVAPVADHHAVAAGA